MNLCTQKNKLGFLALISIAILFGCSSSPTNINRTMLLGKYVANHKKGIDEIELKADGSYRYYFRSKDGREIANSGTWQLEPQKGSSPLRFLISFSGCRGMEPSSPASG